jgi:uncharacterized protein YjbI with pentapeptide repeats
MPKDENLKVRVRSNGFVDVSSINGKRLTAADFSGQTLDNFVSVGNRFKNCQFTDMKIEYACFGSGGKTSHYEDCSFDGTSIACSTPGCASFLRCTFRNVSIIDFIGLNVSMVDCIFSGRLRKIVFYGADPTSRAWFWRKRNEFRGNDFSQASFNDVAFREHIDLSKQKLPPSWVRPDDPYQNVT